MCQHYIESATALSHYYYEKSQEFVVFVGLRKGTSRVVSRARPFTQSLCWERVWSNSHSGLVSTSPGISWTGNWFRVAVMSLYKQCGGIKIAREVFATRQLFSRAIMRAAHRKLLNHTSLTIKTSCPQRIQLC